MFFITGFFCISLSSFLSFWGGYIRILRCLILGFYGVYGVVFFYGRFSDLLVLFGVFGLGVVELFFRFYDFFCLDVDVRGLV